MTLVFLHKLELQHSVSPPLLKLPLTPVSFPLIAWIISRCYRRSLAGNVLCASKVISSKPKLTQLSPKQQCFSSSDTDGLFLDSTIILESKSILIIPDWLCCYNNTGGAGASLYFSSLNKDFHFCFQIIFSPSSHGQRRSLPLMTAALIKPLGSLRTLTTWTDCHSTTACGLSKGKARVSGSVWSLHTWSLHF